MDPKTLRELRELFIASLPTLFLFLFLFFYLRKFFFARIEAVLEERRAATSGTREAAKQSLKRAEAKAAEYEKKLRAARTALYQEQEALRARLREDQAQAMAAERTRTEALLAESRSALAATTVEAKALLAVESEALASQIAKAVLAGRMN